ncbi:MAG: extracellular solute-binding protein [Caldilineaceae bacterium]
MRLFRTTFVVVITVLFLAACGGDAKNSDALSGRILLWHSYDDAATAALEDILARFGELNPHTVVKVQRFDDEAAMMAQFRAAAAGGLGPDALLTSSDWVLPLVEDRLLRPVDAALSENVRGRFMPDALSALQVDGRLYGLPQSVNTTVLFYNRDLVEEPATTLDDLVAEATSGNYVAMASGFVDAFWGVSTFGGQLTDDTGRIILDRGGFANWLEWLKNVRDRPSVVLDADADFLRSQFVDGAVAYLIADSALSPQLAAEMGDKLGVAPLPSGPVGSAAPFLTADAILLNSASSQEQAHLATTLAEFITNVEQSATFMRRTQRVPANGQVRINPRLNPAVSAMAAQARNAVPLPNTPLRDTILGELADAQTRVLEGVLEPATAARETTQTLNSELGFGETATPVATCSTVGVIRVANLLPAPSATVLDDLTRDFRQVCPSIVVQMTMVSTDTVSINGASNDSAAVDPTSTDSAPIDSAVSGGAATLEPSPRDVAEVRSLANSYDLIIGSQRTLLALVQSDGVQELSARADAEQLQRYWPQSIAAMRVDGGLYGQPLAATTSALYFNRALVETPARNLDELERQATDGVPLVLDVSFADAFWGISAFSAQPSTVGFNVVLDIQAQADWLDWLLTLERDARAQLVFTSDAARRAFMDGGSGYFVGRLSDYAALADALGTDNVGVATLPSGPGATPRRSWRRSASC